MHAPRQSGKTSAIIEFVKELNQESEYQALYLSVEAAHYAVNDVKKAVQAILGQFKNQMSYFFPEEKEAILFLEKLL